MARRRSTAHRVLLPDSREDFRDDGHASVRWPRMTFIVLASLFGVGALALPSAFQRLGWAPAISAVVAAAGISAYAGALYARLMTRLPWCSSFHELAARALGSTLWGTVLVAATAYLPIFLVPVLLHLVCSQALQQTLSGDDQPGLLWAGFWVAAIVMPLAQVHYLGGIAWLCAAASAVMAASMLLLVYKLLAVDTGPPGGAKTAVVETHTSPLAALVGILDIFFAFSGQEAWIRFSGAMGPYRRTFGASTGLAYVLMTPVLLLVGAAGYWAHGGSLSIHDPITSHLEADWMSRAINGGVLAALLVAYVTHVNVASQTLLEMTAPDRFKTTGSWRMLRGVRRGRPSPHRPATPHPASEPLLSEAQVGISMASTSRSLEVTPAAATPAGEEQVAVRFGVEVVESESEAAGLLVTHLSCVETAEPVAVLFKPEASPQAPGTIAGHGLLAEAPARDEGVTRLLWALTSVSFVLGAWMVGCIWPRFAELEGVVASLGALSAQILLPCLFAALLLPLSRAEGIVCAALCVLSVVLSCTGLVASVVQLVWPEA